MKKLKTFDIVLLSILFIVFILLCFIVGNNINFKKVAGDKIVLLGSNSSGSKSYTLNAGDLMIKANNVTEELGHESIHQFEYSSELKKYIAIYNIDAKRYLKIWDDNSTEEYELPADAKIIGIFHNCLVIYHDDTIKYIELGNSNSKVSIISSYKIILKGDFYYYGNPNNSSYLIFLHENKSYFWDGTEVKEVPESKGDLLFVNKNYFVYYQDNNINVYAANDDSLVLSDSAKNNPAFVFISEDSKMIVGLHDEKQSFAGNFGSTKILKAYDLSSEKSAYSYSAFFYNLIYDNAFEK